MESNFLRLPAIALVLGGTALLPAGAASAEAPWLARWIGRSEASGTSAWLCLRKQVALETVPEPVTVRNPCDSEYCSWVNGDLVVFEGQFNLGPTPQDTYDEFSRLEIPVGNCAIEAD